MIQALFIALGGALGALSRHGLVNLVGSFGDSKFPAGTLLVNILGSFVIGIMYVFIAEKMILQAEWRSIIMVGFLGAFTTFSTFSLEAVTMMQQGHTLSALGYVLLSVLLCLLAVWAAITITRFV